MSSSVPLKTFFHPRFWYAWPVLALMVVLAWMPFRVLWLLGTGFGWLYSRFLSPAHRFAARNIDLCFPELDKKARRHLINTHFRLSGYAILGLSVAWFAPRWRVRKLVALRGWEHLETQYAAGRNVILLAPHFIGLDIAGMRISLERDSVSMYRKARDPLLEYLFQRRTRYGGIVVERSASLKPIIRSIKEGRPFYYLPDQDMGEKLSVFVPFFGIPAATITMLSRLAQTTNAAVVPCIARLLPHGGAEAQFLPALDNFPTDDPVADAARMNLEIEAWVRQMPEQYMWSYRRFKTRPNNEPSLYSK